MDQEPRAFSYPKIDTLYARDPVTFRIDTNRIRRPEFGLVNKWLVTEKIDGMNIRVYLDGVVSTVQYLGRTDRATLPGPLAKWLQDNLPYDKVSAAFDPGTTALLFGEGYGPGIQKSGGNYRLGGPAFRLFDVVVFAGRLWWLPWDGIGCIAARLGIDTVPVISLPATTDTALGYVKKPSAVAWFESAKDNYPQEGVVARTDPPLFDRAGGRVIWKLKGRDLDALTEVA